MISKINLKLPVLFVAVFAVAMTRLLPHWPNFTAVGALAIFGGATVYHSWKAIFVPLSALFISDLIINNIVYAEYYQGFVLFGKSAGWIYAAFILMTVLGHIAIKSFRIVPIAATIIVGSLIFFALTNFGVWMGSSMYSGDLSGLLLAYEAGLPFLLNTIAGNLFFSAILFSAYYKALENNINWIFAR